MNCIVILFLFSNILFGGELKEIRERGVLRHIGVVYANFVIKTDQGVDGLDVELMQLFAKHLNLRYKFVYASWADVLKSLPVKKFVLTVIMLLLPGKRTKKVIWLRMVLPFYLGAKKL